MEVKAETVSRKLVIILTCVLELWMTGEQWGETLSVMWASIYTCAHMCVPTHVKRHACTPTYMQK